MQLRGGGCGQSRIDTVTPYPIKTQTTRVPSGLANQIKFHCERISRSVVTVIDQENNLMNSFQFFSLNQRSIWNLVCNIQLNAQSFDLISQSLDTLIQTLQNLIKQNVGYSLYVLQIMTQLSWILFSFYTLNDNRFLDIEKQQHILREMSLVRDQLKIERNSDKLFNNLYYEFFILKSIITIQPTNSKEAQEILIQFLSGAFKSLSTFTINDDLIQSLKKSVVYIYQEGVKYSRKRKLEVIFALQQLKFSIMDQLESGQDSKTLATILSKMYCEIIRESTDWEIWCSWVQVLSQIFQFKFSSDQLKIQPQLIDYFQGKEFSIPNFDGRNFVSLDHFQISNDDLLKLIFESSVPLQEQAKLQQSIIQGYGLMHSYEQYYFIKLSAIKATNSTLHNSQFSLSQISQFMNLISAIQSGQHQLTELLKQLQLNDQQKIKEAEELLKDLIAKTIQLKQNMDMLQSIGKAIKSDFDNLDTIYEFSEVDKIQVLFLQKYLSCLINSKTFQYIELDQIFKSETVNYLLSEIKCDELNDEMKNLILQKSIDQQTADNLIVNLKLKKQVDQNKSNNTQEKYYYGFYEAIGLVEKIKCFIQWNLEIQFLLSIRLKMINSYKEEEKQSLLKQEIISQSILMTSYDPLQNSLQFMYNKFLKCQNNKILQKLPVDNSHRFIKVLKIVTIEKFTQTNLIMNVLIKYIFKETNLKLDVNVDQELCRLIIDILTDNTNYLNQLCNGIKMISDILKNRVDTEQRDDFIILKDQAVFHDIFPNFSTTNLQQTQIVQSLSKLSIYQDEFLKSFETTKEYIRTEDKEFFSYLESKKSAIANLIELIDIVKLMKITNEKDKEIAQFLCEDIQKQLSECCKLVRTTSVKFESKQIDWNEEVKFFEQLIDELKQIKTRQQEQILLFQQIVTNSEKLQYQIQNYKTLQKLAQKKPQFLQQFQESEKSLQDSLQEYGSQSIDAQIDFQQVQQIILAKEFSNYPSDLEPQISFILNQIENKDGQQKTNDYFDLIQQGINDLLSNNQWRIRQFLVYELIQMRKSCLQQNSVSQNLGLFIRFQVYETDKRIRSLFDDKQYSLSNQLMSRHWPSQETIIQNRLKEKLKELNELAQQISIETSENYKQQLRKEYSKLEKDIQQILENVQQLSNSLGITVIFLQDLKQDLLRIENYILQMQETLDSISKDIKYLKGRTIFELLELRMKKVLQSRLIFNSDNVYIPIKTKLKLNDSQYSIEKSNLFTEDLFGDGEINEFIWKQQKDSFLIHGQAGSGKSTAARKIEEFLWMFYQRNKKSSDYIPLIPIFVSLPQLRDPVYGCLEETLKSDNYRFNERQIQDLQEAVEQRKIKLVIILDSYDELKSDYIGLNLIISNKLYKWRCQADKNNFPKIITTCRSEIFNIAGYNTWFLSESSIPQYYKEVKLLKFNNEQQKLYIDQYTLLCVKRDVREFYFSNNTQDYAEYETFFSELVRALDLSKIKSDNQFMLNQKIIQQILFKCSNFVSKEMQKTLGQLLSEIWSSQQYLKFIQIMKLDKVIETPFMAEIVMAVLPYIIRSRSEINNVKYRFIKRFIYFAKIEFQLLQVSQLEKQALDEWQTIIHNQQFINDYLQEFSEIQVDKLITKYFSNNQRFNIIKNALMLEPLSTYDFYSQFLEHYFKRQIYKLREQGESIDYEQIGGELWKFTHNLANEMTFRNMTQVYFQPSGLIFKKQEQDWRDEFFNDQCEVGVYKRLFRKCMPIKQKNGIYSFNHKSLQEFLVAKWFVEYLQNIKFPIEEQQKKQLIQSEFCLKSWQFEYLKGSIQFIANKLKYNEEQKQQLLSFVYLTRSDNDFIIAGSNSLLLLNEMDHSFIDMDLSSIKIQDVSLSGANFFNSDFSNSILNGVTLSSVNLNLSKLQNCQWKDIKLNQLPKINTQLGNIKSLTFIEREKMIIVLGESKNVDQKNEMKQYDIFKVQEVNKINVQIAPKLIVLSNSQRILAFINENQIIIYDVYDFKIIQNITYAKCFEKDKQCCVFGSDDKSLILGGQSGAHELKLTIDFVERKSSKKVTDKDRRKNKSQQKNDQDEKNDIIQQQKDIEIQIDSFKQLITEQVIDVKYCKIIVIQKQSKTIHLYNQQTQTIKSIETKFEKINCIDTNLQLNLLAVGSRKGEITLINLSQTEQPVNLSGHKEAIAEIKFSTEGKILVSCSFDQSIILWSTQQLSQINQAKFTNFIKIFSLALITNTYLAVTGQNNGLIQIWDLDSQDTSISNPQGHLGVVECCIFSNDGNLLISGSNDLLIKIWNTQTGLQIGQNLEKHQLPIKCLALSNDSNILCSGGEDGLLVVWDLQTYQVKNQINHYAAQILQIAIYINEGQINYLTLTDEKLLHLWQGDNLNEFTLIYDYQDETKRKILNIESKELLDQSKDQKVNIVESYNISKFIKAQNQCITALAISLNGLQKLIGTGEGLLIVLENKQLVKQFQAHKKNKIDVIFVLNEKIFLTSCQNSIIFWKFSDFTQYSNYQSKFNKINDYFVSNDNFYVSIDYSIRIWNISQKSTVKIIREKKKDNITAICLKNSNTLYAGTQNGNLLIIDLQKSDQYQVISDIHNGRIKKIAWIKNQTQFMTAGVDGILKLWKDDKPIRVVDTESTISQFYLSQGENYFVLQTFDGLSIWSTEDLVCSEKITTLDDNQEVLVLFQQRRIIWSKEDQLYYVPILQKKIKYSYAEQQGNHYPISFAVSGNTIFSGDKSGNLALWNYKGEKQRELLDLKCQNIIAINLSEDQQKLTIAFQQAIKVLTIENLEIIYQKEMNDFFLNSINFLNEKILIITTNQKDKQVVFLDIEDNSLMIQNEHDEEVKGTSVNFKTQSYASFSADKSIRYYQKQNQTYSMKFCMSQELKFESQDAILDNSTIISKTGIDLQSLFKDQKMIATK